MSVVSKFNHYSCTPLHPEELSFKHHTCLSINIVHLYHQLPFWQNNVLVGKMVTINNTTGLGFRKTKYKTAI